MVTVPTALQVLALASVDALPTAACAMNDVLVEECRLNQDVPPQPCEGGVFLCQNIHT